MTAVMFAVVASLLQLPATSADALSCPVGWRLYVDTSGFEGRDVCLLLAPTPMFWNDANTYCQNVAPGGQLLTSAQQTAISVTGTDIMSIATSMLQPHCASGYTPRTRNLPTQRGGDATGGESRRAKYLRGAARGARGPIFGAVDLL